MANGDGISVKIDGSPALATSGVAWALTQGMRPHIGRFDLPKNDVERLKIRGGAITLEISDGTETVKIENLYVIGDAPGPNPHVETILVADRRYWWSYAHVLRRFNKRRHIGHKRISADDTPMEARQVEPDVWYAPYSLPDGNAGASPWTAHDALDEVLKEVLDSEPNSETSPGYTRESLPVIDALPFENVEIDDNGQDALRRLMAYLPGVGITLKADGTVVIYSRVDGAESKPLDERWPEYKNFGHMKRITKELIRPREVHVLFSREFEIRCDFEDQGAGDGTGTLPDVDEIWADNVMPLPDYQLTVSGHVLPRGTWVSFQEAIPLWTITAGDKSFELSTTAIREAMIPYNTIWSKFGSEGMGKSDPDNDWGARIAAIQAHWRQTFRINRRVIDRTYGIYAYRLATINPETGTRAPAVCYSDYAVFPGSRMTMQEEGTDTSFVMNFVGYPETLNDQGNGVLDSKAKPAPAIVKVIDKDQGIVRVDWHPDPLRTYEMIFPGFIETSKGNGGSSGSRPENAGPMADLSDITRTITFNSVTKDGLADRVRMSAGYKCILMLTAVPASPNNDSQLQRVVVKPDEVREHPAGRA